MRSYKVIWEIDGLDADSPLGAAKEALKIQRDPESIAIVFEVYDDETNEWLGIFDISELEDDVIASKEENQNENRNSSG